MKEKQGNRTHYTTPIYNTKNTTPANRKYFQKSGKMVKKYNVSTIQSNMEFIQFI